MKLRGFLLKRRGRRGFGTMELAVSLVITSMIGLSAAIAIAQVTTQTSHNSDYNMATTQVLNAVHWMSRDAQMAQNIDPDGETGFPLDLEWVEWDNTDHQVTYQADGDTLRRCHYIDGELGSTTLISRYINWTAANTTCVYNSDNVVELKITATVGAGDTAVSITKWRNVIPRPGL